MSMTSTFNRMANLVTANELQRRIPDYYHDRTIDAECAIDLFVDNGFQSDYVVVINEQGCIVGVLYLPSLYDIDCGDYDGMKLSECCDPIDPNNFISSNTTALRIAEIFSEKGTDILYVIDNDRITGTICYTDLYQMEFIMCLFVMALSFEEAALGMIRAQATGADWWKCLSLERQSKTISLYELRFGRLLDGCEKLPYDDLLECTTCCDKQKIIRKLKLFKDAKANAIHSIFDRVEKMRNNCAHAVSERRRASFNIKRAELGPFISEVQELTKVMCEFNKFVQQHEG